MLVLYPEWHFCSYTSYYTGNLAMMKLVLLTLQLWMLETCSILIFMYHSDLLPSPSTNVLFTLSLWIKTSAKCPECKCKCNVMSDECKAKAGLLLGAGQRTHCLVIYVLVLGFCRRRTRQEICNNTNTYRTVESSRTLMWAARGMQGFLYGFCSVQFNWVQYRVDH